MIDCEGERWNTQANEHMIIRVCVQSAHILSLIFDCSLPLILHFLYLSFLAGRLLSLQKGQEASMKSLSRRTRGIGN